MYSKQHLLYTKRREFNADVKNVILTLKKNCLRFYKLILNLRGLVWLPLSAISHRLNPPHNEWGGGVHMNGMTGATLALTCGHTTTGSTTGVKGV